MGQLIWSAIWLSVAGFGAPQNPPGFRIGMELPSQVPVPKVVESFLQDVGVNYVGFYVSNAAHEDLTAPNTVSEIVAMCQRLGLSFTLDCHHRNPRPESIRAAAGAGDLFEGVVIDELTHIRLLYPEFSPPDPDELLADVAKFHDLMTAYDQTMVGLVRLKRRFSELGVPQVVATEVWPTLLHAAARAGMTPCPKICKEFYSPVSLAVGLGAALQYDRDLWVDVDMWYFTTVPGHSPDEVRANLMLAYWLGADLVYLEGCGYNLLPAGKQGFPFSLMIPTTPECYQLTPHGKMLKEFCSDYLPTHPRPYTFRELKPSIAIIRFDDTDVGQKAWGVDRLYGAAQLMSDRDTAAWLALWNVLTWGKTGTDGIAWFKTSVPHPADNPDYHVRVTPSYLTEPACNAHTFFVPLNNVVVFDHLVTYRKLKGIPLLFLVGKYVSDETMEAVRRCVAEGAICVAWGPLAASKGFSSRHGGVRVIKQGRGKFVLTDDFESRDTIRHFRRFLGRSDEIRYRFGTHTVVLKRITDNTVDVRVTGDAETVLQHSGKDQ